MYFFYIDETGARDPRPVLHSNQETTVSDHLYVLTAVSLYEKNWLAFDQELSDLKLKLKKKLFNERGIEISSLAACLMECSSLIYALIPPLAPSETKI